MFNQYSIAGNLPAIENALLHFAFDNEQAQSNHQKGMNRD